MNELNMPAILNTWKFNTESIHPTYAVELKALKVALQ